MIPGSFCYRREAEKIRRRLYWSLRTLVKTNRDTVRSYDNVYDLYAGTGCLTELVLRALVIKGSYGSLVQVVLIDRRPRPRLRIELGSWLRMMPDVGRRIRIRFEATDPELKPLVDTLNSLREAVHDHNIRGRRTFRSKSPAFDTVVLRALQEAGKVRLHIQLAEERIRDAKRSKAKNVFRAGTLFILDPPRENGKDYYKSKADPDYVLEILSRHQALVLYVNYISAIRRVLEKTDLRVWARYTLYSTGSASRHENYRVTMTFLVPKTTRGRTPDPDFLKRKRFIPKVTDLVDPLVVSHLNEPRLAELDYPPRDFWYQKKKAGLLRRRRRRRMKAYVYRERLPKRLELGIEFELEAPTPKALLRLQFILLDVGFELIYHRGHLRWYQGPNGRKLKVYVNRSQVRRTYAYKRKKEGVYRYHFRMEFYLPKSPSANLLRRLELLLRSIVSRLFEAFFPKSLPEPEGFFAFVPEGFYDRGDGPPGGDRS